MSDDWARVAIVVAVLASAGLGAFLLSRRSRSAPFHPPVAHTTPAGVYLFSSTACAGCESARRTIVERLGPTGFVEIVWEEKPGWFTDLGVEAVPSTLIVTDDGVATVFPGQPGRALRALDP